MANEPLLFLCNGAALPRSVAAKWKAAKPNHLSTGKGGSVRIELPQLAKKLAGNVHPRFADLAEIAALVYGADQGVSRRGTRIDYGKKWIRDFRFEMAVRDPEFWNDQEVQKSLLDALDFLMNDRFEFRFSLNRSPTPFADFFGVCSENIEGIEEVALFSGGLDSLAGAAESIISERKRIALVSHQPAKHVGSMQDKLVKALNGRRTGQTMPALHLPLVANRVGEDADDFTQRSRSFLFSSIAAVASHIFGLPGITFSENGIVSCNLPLCEQEVNARASRTTHPKSLHLLERLLSHVSGRQFLVRNKYLDLTKQDVVQRLRDLGCQDLILDSISCSHTRQTSNRDQPQCGTCSQCLSRRFATYGLDLNDVDPDNRYRTPVFTGERSETTERTLAERYIGSARQINAMLSVEQFQQTYANDIARLTRYMAGTTDDCVRRLYDLHRLHAVQICAAAEKLVGEYAGQHWRGQLASTCPVTFAFQLAQPDDYLLSNQPTNPEQEVKPEELALLGDIDREFLFALEAHKIFNLETPGLPSQAVVAKWMGRDFDTSVKNCASALVKARYVANARHFGRRGGYFLTGRGRIAIEILRKKVTSHDQTDD